MFKKIIILVGIFSLFGMIYGETITIGGYLKLTKTVSCDNYTFPLSIDSSEDKYLLKFTHYGTATFNANSTKIYLYLNGHLIYSIDDTNNKAPSHEGYVNIPVDKSYFEIHEDNILQLNGPVNNGYYVVRDFELTYNNTSTAFTTMNVPPPTPSIIFSILLITILILRNKINNK